METEILLTIKDLCVEFEGKKILDKVSFSIAAAKIITLIGPNGSGKTTLVRSILGVVKPTSGSIRSSDKLIIGYMPQKLNLNKNLPLNVIDFLRLEVNRKITNKLLNDITEELGIAHILPLNLQKLSGGEMQRTLLAKAMLAGPNLLILDEPIGGLDINGQIEFYKLIDKLRIERGVSILIISHDLHTVMRRTDYVICLHHHICCEGSPDFVNQQPYFNNKFDSETLKALSIYEHRHDHRH